jgi:PAS domain S-box-containing protein
LHDSSNADQQLQALFRAFPDPLFILDGDGTIQDFKPGDSDLPYQNPEELLGRKIQEILPFDVVEGFQNALDRARQTKETITLDYPLSAGTKNLWLEARLVVLPNGQVAAFVRDITARKENELTNRRQVDRLSALRAIDMAITSSLDLRLTLSILVNQVKSQLRVDAASILLMDIESQTLRFATGDGFRTSALRHTALKHGEGYAGRAASRREVIRVSSLANRQTDFLRSPHFAQEGFVDYFAVPLIAKARVLGVLEVFHRSKLRPKPDWLDFMEMLAGQAAIAVESAMMFNNFERTNTALTLAYDATIDGWSRALELRDRETEGHTQRVAEMAIRLASMLGMSEQQIVHLRRGAVLHDIGKMAIPDNILFKAGPLDAMEWDVMRQHTSIATELLKPIPYLAPALEIPQFHHEKWDGTGYPHGLKAEQIPLAARLFAVVDVYDAVTSDRPYRKAWSHGQAIDHIRAESGKHFDPKVVEAFLKMVEPQGQNSSLQN